MERLFLIGYMGAGKTTLGVILAKQRGLEFIDLDHFIESRHQKTVSQIFEEFGEERFREIESTLLKEVAQFENVLISTGGGAPCFFDNMEYMNNHGTTIYLKSSAQSLAKRLMLCKNKRPLIKDKDEKELIEFIETTLKIREQNYNQAHIIYDVNDFTSVDEAKKTVSSLDEKIDNQTTRLLL